MEAGRPGTKVSRVRALAAIGVFVLSIIAIGTLGVVLGDLFDGGNRVGDDEESNGSQSSNGSPETGESEGDSPGENSINDSGADRAG